MSDEQLAVSAIDPEGIRILESFVGLNSCPCARCCLMRRTLNELLEERQRLRADNAHLRTEKAQVWEKINGPADASRAALRARNLLEDMLIVDARFHAIRALAESHPALVSDDRS